MSGCIACKKVVQDHLPEIEQGLESAFDAAFALIKASAEQKGVELHPELRNNLRSVGEAHGLFKATVVPLVPNQ